MKSDQRKVDSCPGCGKIEYLKDSRKTAGFSTTVAGREFCQEDYYIRNCADCGLLFRDPIPCEEELAQYYQLLDFRKWEFQGFYPTERAVLSELRRCPKGSRFLDVGCS